MYATSTRCCTGMSQLTLSPASPCRCHGLAGGAGCCTSAHQTSIRSNCQSGSRTTRTAAMRGKSPRRIRQSPSSCPTARQRDRHASCRGCTILCAALEEIPGPPHPALNTSSVSADTCAAKTMAHTMRRMVVQRLIMSGKTAYAGWTRREVLA